MKYKLEISSIVEDIDTKNYLIEVKFYNVISHKIDSVLVPYEQFNEKDLDIMLRKNGTIISDMTKQFQELEASYFSMIENGSYDIKLKYKRIGWFDYNNEYIFLGDRLIGCESLSRGNKEQHMSSYEGKIDIKPRGDKDSITHLINESICNQTEWSSMEFVLSLAAACTILPYANKFWGADISNFIVHLSGKSSTGKTTALELFASMGGNPKGTQGTKMSYLDTIKSILQKLGTSCGIPIGIDEYSTLGRGKIEEFIYAIGNGTESNKVGKIGGVFQTIVLSTGENALLNKSKGKAGLNVRAIEVDCQNWTSSKEQSIRIKETVMNNYGIVAPLIAEELILRGEEWKNKWDECCNIVETKMKEDKASGNVVERINSAVSLIRLGAMMLSQVLDVDIKIEKVLDFTYMHFITNQAEEINIGKNVYERILAYLSGHPDKISENIKGVWNTDPNGETLMDDYVFEPGILALRLDVSKPFKGKKYNALFLFKKDDFVDLLKSLGYQNIKLALNELRDLEVIKTISKQAPYWIETINNIKNTHTIELYADVYF